MKHKYCKEIIAWAEGKTIQRRKVFKNGVYNVYKDDWVDDDDPFFDESMFEFRVKPEPLFAYVNTKFENGVESINSYHSTESDAKTFPYRADLGRVAVKMVEVEDDRE